MYARSMSISLTAFHKDGLICPDYVLLSVNGDMRNDDNAVRLLRPVLLHRGQYSKTTSSSTERLIEFLPPDL